MLILTILSLISAIASGIYSYQTGSLVAEAVCVFSVLGFAVCLCVIAFGGNAEAYCGSDWGDD